MVSIESGGPSITISAAQMESLITGDISYLEARIHQVGAAGRSVALALQIPL